jgi:hypothetical protein
MRTKIKPRINTNKHENVSFDFFDICVHSCIFVTRILL